MRVLDLFSGLRGWSDPWRARGHEVFTLDNDPRFEPDLCVDILNADPGWFDVRFDVILASPPCEAFSVLRIGRNWNYDHTPKTPGAWLGLSILTKTVELIEHLEPDFFIIENPVGKMRRMPVLADYERRSVTYCQYGAPWMKPTDLWGGFPPSLVLRPGCSQGAPCHLPAPRGSTQGIQSDTSSKDPKVRAWFDQHGGARTRAELAAVRSKIPEPLSLEICIAAERDLDAGLSFAAGQSRLF